MVEPGCGKSFSWVFKAPGLSPPPPPSPLSPFSSPPLPSASHSVGSSPTAGLCPPSRDVESRGQNTHPKVPSASKYLLLCLHTKINTPMLWADPHCPPGLWRVRPRPALAATMAAPTMQLRGRLVAHTKHPPGHYHSGAEIHPARISSVIQQPLMTCQFLALLFSV